MPQNNLAKDILNISPKNSLKKTAFQITLKSFPLTNSPIKSSTLKLKPKMKKKINEIIQKYTHIHS